MVRGALRQYFGMVCKTVDVDLSVYNASDGLAVSHDFIHDEFFHVEFLCCALGARGCVARVLCVCASCVVQFPKSSERSQMESHFAHELVGRWGGGYRCYVK